MSDDINNRLVNYLIHKPKDQVIDKFEEYFSFLNNDEPSWVLYENIFYPSVSVAFQGARAPDHETKERIANVDSPDELIEIAQAVEDPADWESRRLKVMEILIRDKFRRSLEMRERLRLTEEKYHEESPSNLYWGIVGNKGQNQIGRILERVRADINENSDLKKWLQTKFPLQSDKILLPVITLNVSKDGELIETISLKERSYYYMGQYKTNSVLLAHPSISRLHACIICEEGNKVRLIDMESKSGSFVNGEILEKLSDRELQNGDILTFALSTRSYEIQIDYTEAQKELQKRNIQLQQQVKQLQRLNQPSLTPEELKRIMGFSIDDTLFVSGLPDNATVLGVRQLFQEHAKVKEVKIPVDKWSGKQRGFAYVIFETKEEFSKAFLHSMNLKYGETKVKVKIADKEKSSQLMNICRIDDDDKRRKNDNWGRRDRNDRDRNDRNDRDKGRDRNDRDSKYKRRSSKSRSRSRSDERRDRDKNRSSRSDKDRERDREREKDREERKDRFSSKNDKSESDKPEKKDTKVENDKSDKDKEIEREKEKEKEKDAGKSKDNKDERRKRSSSRDQQKKKESRRDRSDSRQKKSKPNDKEKRRSPSPKSKGTSSTTGSKKQSSRSSRSRSRDRRDSRKPKQDSRSKRSDSRGKDRKERTRRSRSKDRKNSKSKERQDKKQSNKSEQPKSDKQNNNERDQKSEKVEKSSSDKVAASKEVEKQSSKDQDKQQQSKQSEKEQSKENQRRSRKKSESSGSSGSQSSGSSSSSRSSSSSSNSNSNSRSSSSSSSFSSQSSQ